MSESDVPRREREASNYDSGRAASEEPVSMRPSKGAGEAPSMFVQIVGAVAIGLLAVVAAQGFLTARDVSVVSQNVGTLAGRLQAESEKSRKLFDEVVILRGQLGELKNFLLVSGGRGGGGGQSASGDKPPGPADWTGVYVSELAPLLPVLAQYQGDMGEAWIYTDNEAFIESIARALEQMGAGGVEVDVEQPQ